MFSTTRCFDSTSHAATITAPAAPDGSTHAATRSTSTPVGSRIAAVKPMSTAATERDQHVVDEPFAREADEVHAPLVRSDRAAHVRVGDREPEHDGQMERDENLGVRVRIPRVEVDHERSEHERRRRQHPAPGVELPSAGEVRGEKRQHEQTGVPRQPGRLLVGEAGREACDLDRDGRGQGEDERRRASRWTRAPARRHRSGRAASTVGRCARVRTPGTGRRGRPSVSRRRGTPRRVRGRRRSARRSGGEDDPPARRRRGR